MANIANFDFGQEPRRLAVLRVALEILVEVCKHQGRDFVLTVGEHALPDDAKLVRHCINFDFHNGVCLIVESRDFALCAPGELIPVLRSPTTHRKEV